MVKTKHQNFEDVSRESAVFHKIDDIKMDHVRGTPYGTGIGIEGPHYNSIFIKNHQNFEDVSRESAIFENKSCGPFAYPSL